MSDLPAGWTETTLGEIASQGQYGWTSKAAEKGQVKYLRTTDITSGHLNWDTVPYCQDNPPNVEKYKIEPGDILISRAGSVGFSALIEDVPSTPAVFASYLIRYIPNSQVNPKFVARFLQSPNYWQQISDASAGIALANVNAKKLANVILPLPPLDEQKRIAEKLDSLLARVDSCHSHLERVPQILKRFRQSVLAAATSGRLTEDWREEQTEVENAGDLLKRILERRLSNAQRQTERKHLEDLLQNLSADFISNGDLPKSWAFTSIDYIGLVCNGSTPSRKVPSYWNGDISWISSGEVRNSIIKESRERITQEGYKNSSVRLLPKGTVLLAMIGEGKTRGQTAILDIEACINQNMAAIVLDHGLVNSKYLWYWLQSVYEANRRVGSGSGPQALNCQRVRELPCILPPLEEQAEIVRRVEKLFAYAERLEARYTSASEHVERLTPSLLAKAFRGELVSQEQG